MGNCLCKKECEVDVENYNKSLLKWDRYFYNNCREVSKNTSCLSRQIGAILVKDKTIIGTGYNGPPRGVPHCDQRFLIDPELRGILEVKGLIPEELFEMKKCPRQVLGYKSGEGLQWCVAGHAERNTLINSARMGIKTKKCKLYMDCGIPCTPCLVEIINAGIEEIICANFGFYDSSAKYLLDNSPLKVRMYSHLCEHKNISKDLNDLSKCFDCGLYVVESKEKRKKIRKIDIEL